MIAGACIATDTGVVTKLVRRQFVVRIGFDETNEPGDVAQDPQVRAHGWSQSCDVADKPDCTLDEEVKLLTCDEPTIALRCVAGGEHKDVAELSV